MASKYDKMAALWKNTIKANPYYDEVSRDGCWWRLDEYLVDSGIAADILEDKYIGIKVKGCAYSTLRNLWDRLGSERTVRDWMAINDKENEVERGYNMRFWTTEDRDYYKKEEEETEEVEPLTVTQG